MDRLVARIVAASTLGIAGAPNTHAQTAVRFVVGELPGRAVHNDSYTLDLTSPADIAHARRLVALGQAAGAPIVTARIAAGNPDRANRNHAAPGAPAWSWRIVEFQGFSDVTIELIDGWPTFIEGDVSGWLANTRLNAPAGFGHIGFWNYTVTRELGPVCAADFDNDARRTIEDIFVYLAAWFAGEPRCDQDGTQGVTLDDLLLFINRWFAGC